MKFTRSINWPWALLFCLLCDCAPVNTVAEANSLGVITSDNQAGIWLAGITLYAKGQFVAAADLFQLAYRLKPASRISQNLGMAYFKAAQFSEYPAVLRLEYVSRALPYLRNYRLWLKSDYGRTHPIERPLAETNQRIVEAERLESTLRAIDDQTRTRTQQAPGR